MRRPTETVRDPSAATGSTPKLSIQDVSKTFESSRGSVQALTATDLDVQEGEFVTIVGPSGCGKSTLLMIASGLETPSSGRVLIDDDPAGPPGPRRSVVFQQFALFPHMTAEQNIGFGLRMRGGLTRARKQELVAAQVETMRLTGFEKAYPSELSGGMQQRVAIARALVLDPEILLMDEPFGALDAQTRTAMQDEMAAMRSRLNCTILFVTHSVEEAVFLGDRIVVMSARPGRISHELSVSSDFEWKRHQIEHAMSERSFNELREEVWRHLHAGGTRRAVHDAPDGGHDDAPDDAPGGG
ncbi:NitT/TauT family transport system ATP-binding protein [Haloactinopolyspora alba]|uniref:NitT/TauT family transport system ATP-binding protein n=1 Tax=Haloactinopolyspora alba TaxID=648780 RepID=A0A2P8E042_9ACTN|nr:ABC transporter ATP-binding protein [Haloactinopolyspora alba]PSL02841.1 NitT/TauT family transport system ATP-binding protein [Haloactinopolyspora alba]